MSTLSVIEPFIKYFFFKMTQKITLINSENLDMAVWTNYHDVISFSDLALFLYPRNLCRGVYSFRLSVCPFVCSFVRLFVLPSVTWNLRQSFASKFLKWCISKQLLIRKHSYLDHSYPGGLAVTPWSQTPGSMPQCGAIGQNLGHL